MATVKAVPEGLRTLTAQLTLEGAADAIAFLKKVFGAEESERALDPSGKKIMHALVRIGDSSLYVNDVFPEMGGSAETASLWIYTEDADGVFKRAVDAGAVSTMAMADQFWGDRTGQVKDRWGNRWNIAKRIKNMTPEEMKKAEAEFFKNPPKN